MESIYKSYQNGKLDGLSAKTKWSKRREVLVLLTKATLIEVENVSRKQISIIYLNYYWITLKTFCGYPPPPQFASYSNSALY
jgi:hypothetical protein